MKVFITGDSHTGALNRGLVSLSQKGALAPDLSIHIRPLGGGHLLPTPFFEDAGTHATIIEPEYTKHIAQLPPAGGDFDAIGLSMPLWPMRVVHQLVWDNWSLGEVAGRKPMSKAVFKELVKADQKYVLQLAELLQRSGVKVLAISAPRLFRDHNVLRFIPEAQGLHIFETFRELQCAELKKRKIDIIDVPDACLDADGFMRPEFRHEDPKDEHHANAAFGELMIQNISRHLLG